MSLSASGEVLEGELGYGKALVMFMDGLWVLRLSWNGLELRNGISIFTRRTQFWSRVFLAIQAWLQSGKISPIYKEGVGMDRWENESGLVRNHKWFEACSRMNFLGCEMKCSDLVCFKNHLVLVLRIKQVQQEALEWPAMHFSFNQFGKILKIAHDTCFLICELSPSKLNLICALICCVTC